MSSILGLKFTLQNKANIPKTRGPIWVPGRYRFFASFFDFKVTSCGFSGAVFSFFICHFIEVGGSGLKPGDMNLPKPDKRVKWLTFGEAPGSLVHLKTWCRLCT